jgi:hypothetical protein
MMARKLNKWNMLAVAVSVVLFIMFVVFILKKKSNGIEIWYTSATEPNGYVVLHDHGMMLQYNGKLTSPLCVLNDPGECSPLCFGPDQTGALKTLVRCTDDQKRVLKGDQPITVTKIRVDPSAANWVSLKNGIDDPEYHTVGVNEDPLYPKTGGGWFITTPTGCLEATKDPLPMYGVTGISIHTRIGTLTTECNN